MYLLGVLAGCICWVYCCVYLLGVSGCIAQYCTAFVLMSVGPHTGDWASMTYKNSVSIGSFQYCYGSTAVCYKLLDTIAVWLKVLAVAGMAGEPQLVYCGDAVQFPAVCPTANT